MSVPTIGCSWIQARSSSVRAPELVEDVVGDADLAHVVEVGALGQGAQGRRPQPQPQADADRQLGHARRVPVGVGVARLDRADEGPQGLGVAAADVCHRVAGEHPVEHVVEPAAAPIAGQDRIDGRGEAGQQEDVIVPPGQMPGPADLQRQQRPGAQQARHHQRQLHAVEPEPPAPPVHRADGDQHQGRAQHQPEADAGLARQGPAAGAGGRPQRDGQQHQRQGQAARGQGPGGPAAGPGGRGPPRPGGRGQAHRERRDRQHGQAPDPQVDRPSPDPRGHQPVGEHEEPDPQAAQREQQHDQDPAPNRPRGSRGAEIVHLRADRQPAATT